MRHRNLLSNWTRVHSHERTSVEPPLKMAKNTCTIHASVKCSKARITVLPCQVVPSTPCLSWSLFDPSFCYCSAPWYSHWCNLHQTPPPERLHFNSSISWHGNLLYGAYDLRFIIPFIRTGGPLETCTWMWAHDTRRHIDALKTEAGDGLTRKKGWDKVTSQGVNEDSVGQLKCLSKTETYQLPPRADRPACGTLSCKRRDVVSNLTRRKPSRTEGLLKSLQSVYCT